MEGPCVLGVQLPHTFPADILIDEGSVVFHETVADLVQDDAAVAAFDEAAVGVHEGEPEADIVVLDLVKAPLALFGVLLGGGDLPLQDVRVDQGLEVLGQARGLRLQDRRNDGELAVTGGDGTDDREVAAHLADLLLQQEVGLVVQVARPVQHTALDGVVNTAAFGKQLDILGHAASDGVHFDQFLPAFVGEEQMVISEWDLLQPDLRRPSAVQGTAVGQGLRLHHGDQRAAENDHHGPVLQDLLPDPLEYRGEGRVGFADILRFVDDDHGLAVELRVHDRPEDGVPAFDVGLPEQIAVDELRRFVLENVPVLGLRFLAGQEKQGLLILDKFRDQGCLADSPPPVQHHKGAALPSVFHIQSLHLLFPINKQFHRIASFFM